MNTIEYLTTVLYGTFTPPNVPSRRYIGGRLDESVLVVVERAKRSLGGDILLLLSMYEGIWLSRAEIVEELNGRATTIAQYLADMVKSGDIQARKVKGDNGRPYFEYARAA